MAAQTKRKRRVDPDDPKRIDRELWALLTNIPRNDPNKRPRFLDDRGTKFFALNLARILHHHGLSAETAARRLRTSMATLIGWLRASGKRPITVAENMARHLGVGGWELVERVFPFAEIERITLGKGWLPPHGWNRSADDERPKAVPEGANDDDDGANWWKKGATT